MFDSLVLNPNIDNCINPISVPSDSKFTNGLNIVCDIQGILLRHIYYFH